MSSEAEQNKTLVRRLFEARGKLDMDALDKMLAPHFLSHATRVLAGQQLDREGYKRTTLEYHAAFSNTSFMFEEQVAEADKVVSRISGRATHDLRGVSGRRAYRQGDDLHGHLHPPHRGGQDRRGAQLGNGRPSTDGAASGARED